MGTWLHSVMTGTSTAVPVRLVVGDDVEVLSAIHLPRFEKVIGRGVIERVTGTEDAPLYWIAGMSCARTAQVLRLVRRGRV